MPMMDTVFNFLALTVIHLMSQQVSGYKVFHCTGYCSV